MGECVMTVQELIDSLKEDFDGVTINPDADVKLLEGIMLEWVILSVYPSEDGKTLYIDIEPE
jgi:hypothetical protein